MKKRFFELAKHISTSSDHHQHKMAAILVKKNRIVSFGYNEIKTHPKSLAAYNMLHAEVSALLCLDYEKTKGCDMYVFRQTKQGVPALARPCPGCFEAMKKAGVKRVFYSAKNDYLVEEVA